MVTLVHEIVNPITGKTVKQENLERGFIFPLDSLVEYTETGIRLFVTQHVRDCDGSPLYYLGPDKGCLEIKDGPYGEEGLTLVKEFA